MTELSQEEFIEFLESYKDKENCYDSISNISWPKDKKGNNDLNKPPLVKNDDFFMYSLDDICKKCKGFNENNIPTTTDALWYNINEDGKLVLYFIEFKGHNLDRVNDDKFLGKIINDIENNITLNKNPVNKDILLRLNQLKDAYDDEIRFNLRLKPFESLFIVLPTLYREYCGDDCKDLYSFLKTCDIKIFTFAGVYTKEDSTGKGKESIEDKNEKKSMKIEVSTSKKGKKSKRNKSKDRHKFNTKVGPKGSIGSTIYKQYKRYQLNPLIKFADIYPKDFFNTFLEEEGLI